MTGGKKKCPVDFDLYGLPQPVKSSWKGRFGYVLTCPRDQLRKGKVRCASRGPFIEQDDKSACKKAV